MLARRYGASPPLFRFSPMSATDLSVRERGQQSNLKSFLPLPYFGSKSAPLSVSNRRTFWLTFAG